MNEAVPMDLVIADLQISGISDSELDDAFHRVLAEHKDAVASIHQSMMDADAVYRKYLDPSFEPIEENAKKDRASLNRAEKNIAEKFASLKAVFERPLERIEMNIKEIRSAIKGASGVVDSKVKAYEEAQKSKKYEEIQAYFEGKEFNLVPLDRIFDKTWLNKGTKMRDIHEQIDVAIDQIYSNIEVLERISEYGSTAKAMYLETLNIGAALHQVEILKSNAEKLAREQAAREERKNQEQVVHNAASERREERATEMVNHVQSLVDQALDLPVETTASGKPEIMEYTLRFKGTKEQLLKLREYMTENGIAYEKGYLFERNSEVLEYQDKHGLTKPVFFTIFEAA